MHTVLTIVAACALLAAGSATAAESGGHEGAKSKPHDAKWVKQKVQVCASCHGPKGVSQTPAFPVLAGQYKSYLEHAITAYRDGDRKNPVMAPQAAGLSDAQIDALAAYFSRQKSPLHTPSLY